MTWSVKGRQQDTPCTHGVDGLQRPCFDKEYVIAIAVKNVWNEHQTTMLVWFSRSNIALHSKAFCSDWHFFHITYNCFHDIHMTLCSYWKTLALSVNSATSSRSVALIPAVILLIFSFWILPVRTKITVYFITKKLRKNFIITPSHYMFNRDNIKVNIFLNYS